MKVIKKVNKIEIYELSKIEQAQYGEIFYCIKEDNLNIIDFKVALIEYKGTTLDECISACQNPTAIEKL